MSTRARQGGPLSRLPPFPVPQGTSAFSGGLHRRQGLGGEGPGLPLGPAVGPGDALEHPPDPLVVGGVGVAVGPVHGCQGGLVEADGGHREPALLGQMGEVGGDQGRRRWQGQRCPGAGPGLKAPPGGFVGGAGVVGDAVVQGSSEPLEVGAGQPAGGGGKVLGIGLRGNGQEGVLQSHFGLSRALREKCFM